MTWTNIQDDCPLCEMDQETHWYHEDGMVVVADTLSSEEPFVVLKHHTEEIDDATIERVRERTEELFGDHDLRVKMNVVEDHWHAHIVDPDTDPAHLKDE